MRSGLADRPFHINRLPLLRRLAQGMAAHWQPIRRTPTTQLAAAASVNAAHGRRVATARYDLFRTLFPMLFPPVPDAVPDISRPVPDPVPGHRF